MIASQRGLIAGALFSLSLAAIADGETGFRRFTLDNGLRVILQEKRDLPLCAMTLAADLSPAAAAPAGWPHLLEHLLLFGATREATGPERLARLRARGVQANAHTDVDLITFEYSAPAAHAAWALARLREQVFLPRLQAEHLEAEKRILAEEIAQLRDEPATAGRLRALQLLFGSHPYGRPIEGDPQAIAAATLAEMEELHRRLLVPARCSLALVGDFAAADMEAEIRRTWEGGRAEPAAAPLPPPPALTKSQSAEIRLDVRQAHLFVAWPVGGYNDPDRAALGVLAFILGRGLNPLLAGALRGPFEEVDRLEMRYLPMRHGGAMLLHLLLPARQVRNVQGRLARFLSGIRQLNFSRLDFPPAYQAQAFDLLDSARRQMAMEGGSYGESALNLSSAAARFLLLGDDRADSRDDSLEAVRSADLRRVGGTCFAGRKWVTVAVVPVER